MRLPTALALPLLAAMATAAQSAPLPAQTACRVGAYALPGGRHVTVTGQEKGRIAYLLPDGERGSLSPEGDGVFVSDQGRAPVRLTFGVCGAPLKVVIGDGPAVAAPRITFKEAAVDVVSGDLKLSGKLVAPKGRPLRQIAVFVDGSDQVGAVDRTYWQYELPIRGVGVFVLDKRGTGVGRPSHG